MLTKQFKRQRADQTAAVTAKICNAEKYSIILSAEEPVCFPHQTEIHGTCADPGKHTGKVEHPGTVTERKKERSGDKNKSADHDHTGSAETVNQRAGNQLKNSIGIDVCL